jgi:hypothetical protein
LGLYYLKGWAYDEDRNPISRGRLPACFWINLRNECPRLRTLILRHHDVRHSFRDPWLTEPMIDEINSLSVSNRIAHMQKRQFIRNSRVFMSYVWNGILDAAMQSKLVRFWKTFLVSHRHCIR